MNTDEMSDILVESLQEIGVQEGELLENSVVRKFRITASDGKSFVGEHEAR